MSIENQLNLLDDFEKAGSREQKKEEQAALEKPAKSFEQEYWEKIDALNGIDREEIERLAKKHLPQVLETIEKKKNKPVIDRRLVSIHEDRIEEPSRPYEDIYPYSRNFRRKKDHH